MLGLSSKRVYEHVMAGRLRGVRAVNAIMIPLEEVEKFEAGASGRERKIVPAWRISVGKNTQFLTLILVQIRAGKREALVQKLEEMRKDGGHLFPGTVVRSIVESQTKAGQVIISLMWRGTVMPDKGKREEALEALRRELEDVLDWGSAEYNDGTALIHT